ncbi:MAG TPA: aminoacyl-tRNA hydrolase [Acetobacterium sp.]
MYLIVGLGNIGSKYDMTRHNMGFQAIEHLSEKKGVTVNKKEKNGLTGVYREFGEKIMLAKPTTFMNNSGLCVSGLVNFYEVPLENLLVIYDDIDLVPGDVRIRQHGSGGTHNGMRSIIQSLGSQDFPRIRIGIGKPEDCSDLVNYVLGRFAKSELLPMEDAVIEVSKGVDYFVKDGVDLAMNQINVRKNPEKPTTTEIEENN